MHTQRLLLVIVALVFAGCARVNVYPTGEGTASGTPAAAKPDAEKKEGDPFKPWEKTLEKTRAVDGLLKVHLKRDNTLYAELRPDQLDRDFGMVLHLSRGAGDFDLQRGLPLSEMRLVRFTRVGDKVHLVHRNPRLTADAGSAIARSLDANVGHSVVAAFDIESEHEKTKHLLVNLTGFLTSDYPRVAESVKFYFGGKPVSFDKEKSYVEGVMGFPENVEIDAALNFSASSPPVFGGAGVSDYRSIPIVVRYSIVALPKEPMRPRLADDRVGYFTDVKEDFSRDKSLDPYARYVTRWRLECAGERDAAGLCEPKKPIVFYIDHTVPPEYRRYVREGVEAWNRGFEAAGFKRAIVAQDAPTDSTWSAADARYSTIQWTASHDMGYAIGPSQTDPRTGEILNADILISAEFIRGYVSQFQALSGREAFEHYAEHGTFRPVPPGLLRRLCLAETGLAHGMAVQHALLAGLGRIEPGKPLPEEFVGENLRNLIMHEVGHTLGLRHNFKASAGVPNEKLHDRSFTAEHGVTVSVMDYAPMNVNARAEGQGHYANPGLGSYDVWAIRYGYTPAEPGAPSDSSGRWTPESERPTLQRIAGEAANPLHVYNTDEDNWLGPWAVDPLTNARDLGTDPVRYASERLVLVREVQPLLEDRLVTTGGGYELLRRMTARLLLERFVVLVPVTKAVGGLYFARDHRGDPNARLPFTPVSREQQREAVDLLLREAFEPGAIALTGDQLNKLAPSRHSDWASGWFTTPVDFPIHGYVASLQEVLLDQLLHPARLERMIDNEVRMPEGTDPFTVGDLAAALTAGIWTELEEGSGVDSFRRNAQRSYTDQLIRLLLDAPRWTMATPTGPAPLSAPEHARSVARLELSELSAKLGRALENADLDRDTRAHLAETKVRIDEALAAGVVRAIP